MIMTHIFLSASNFFYIDQYNYHMNVVVSITLSKYKTYIFIILSPKSIRVGDSVPKSSKMLTVPCNKGCHQTQSFLFRIA